MVCSPWATFDDIPDCGELVEDSVAVDANLLIASEILDALSGYVYPGVCEDTVRPVRRYDSISGASVVKLPGSPIVTVEEVVVDGLVVPSSNYVVLNGEFLAWRGTFTGPPRRTTWPTSQRLDLDVTERDTWQVTYTFGRLPNHAGVRACAVLARTMSLACPDDDETCTRVRDAISSIARQGVSYDLGAFMADGGFGIAEVDWWLTSELMGRKRRPWVAYVADAELGYARITDPVGS